MDSAVWGMQAVVDQRRREREADGSAYRQARAVVRGSASGRRARPPRWQRRFAPVAAVVPEPAGDDLELVGAGDSR
jgi:hypothetical protein